MAYALTEFAQRVLDDAKRAEYLQNAIEFLEVAAGADALKYLEIRWADYLLTGGSNGSYEAEGLAVDYFKAAWPDVHHAVLTRAKEELAAIERRYEPLASGS